MKRTNRGAAALGEAMRKRGLTQGDVRRAVGCPSGMVTRWLSGERAPSRGYAAKLDALYRIRCGWWDEPACGAA